MQNVGLVVNKGRGASPEEIADRAGRKIINLADATNAPESIRDETRAFQKKLQGLLRNVAKEAAYNERVTIYNAIRDAGHPDLAQAIMRM